MYTDFTATPIFNKPAIRYQAFALYGSMEIPMHITTYKLPTRNPKVTTITGIPQIEIGSNTAFKGSSVGIQGIELSKIHIEGFLQTPVSKVVSVSPPQEQPLLTLIDLGGNPYYATYADVIAMYFEGRGTGVFGTYVRLDPIWFRDQYGRVFSNPRIIDFTANYLEAVPGRNSFTMMLQI